MNKFRQLCLLLCCLLLLLSGFSPVVSYAYGESDNSYSYEWGGKLSTIVFDTSNWTIPYSGTSGSKEENFFVFNNNSLPSNNYQIYFGASAEYDNNTNQEVLDSGFDFEYLPEVYDYYLIASMNGNAISSLDFTFSPDSVNLELVEHTGGSNNGNRIPLSYNKYCYCGYGYKGWTITAKIPKLTNTSISELMFAGSGTIPANYKFKASFLRVNKDEDITDELQAIIEELTNLEATVAENGQIISNAITEQGTNIVSKIEEQYSVSDEENFGVDEIIDELNEKAGALTFATDVLIDFLDLFSPDNEMSTIITFPSFTINVQGVDYEVWNEYDYNLSDLENNFGMLLDTVRWGTTMLVYVALISYIGKCWDAILGG